MAPKNGCFVSRSACDVTGSDCGPRSPRPGGKDGGKVGGAPGWWRNGSIEEKGGSCPGEWYSPGEDKHTIRFSNQIVRTNEVGQGEVYPDI